MSTVLSAVSPELVLVDPELRAQALLAPPPVAPPAPVRVIRIGAVPPLSIVPAAPDARRPPTTVAALVYLVACAVRFSLTGIVLVGLVAAATALLSLAD